MLKVGSDCMLIHHNIPGKSPANLRFLFLLFVPCLFRHAGLCKNIHCFGALFVRSSHIYEGAADVRCRIAGSGSENILNTWMQPCVSAVWRVRSSPLRSSQSAESWKAVSSFDGPVPQLFLCWEKVCEVCVTREHVCLSVWSCPDLLMSLISSSLRTPAWLSLSYSYTHVITHLYTHMHSYHSISPVLIELSFFFCLLHTRAHGSSVSWRRISWWRRQSNQMSLYAPWEWLHRLSGAT